ncbi:protein kinase, putative, partial [Trypanosoma cruzi]
MLAVVVELFCRCFFFIFSFSCFLFLFFGFTGSPRRVYGY